jgi:hypothetical protein
MEKASMEFATTGQKQRLFEWMEYGAATWDCERRVIAKAEFTVSYHFKTSHRLSNQNQPPFLMV